MGIITAILKRPSQRTQLEATLTGLSVFLLTSLITPIYIIFFSDSSVWFKILSGLGGIGLGLILSSNLAMTYVQYHTFKMSMGLYPVDKKLEMKIEDFKYLSKEINKLIKEYKDENIQEK